MSRLSRFAGGLGGIFRKEHAEQELDEELQAYLDAAVEEKMRAGLSRERALRAARAEAGSLAAARDHVRDAGWESVVASAWQDLRQAVRSLRHSPGFTATAVLTLALGLGANAALFSAIHAILLKPLPFSDPERLMLVHLTLPDREAANLGGLRENTWSYAKYRALLDVQRTFETMALFGGRDVMLAEGHPEQVPGEVITGRYTALLGIDPVLGRSFTEEESHRAGGPAVALLSHALWVRRYASDPAIVGRSIQIDARPHTIVGVLPPGFRGLTGRAEIWRPLAVAEPSMFTQRNNHSYFVVARRKADVSEQTAIAAVRDYGRHVDAEFNDRPAGPDHAWGATAVSLYDSRVDTDVRRAAYVLLGAVGFLLLIACVNLTSLLVARALARRREVAIRLAIGASRLRIARQLLTETLVLAALGGVAALGLAELLLAGAGVLLPDANIFLSSPIAPGVPRVAGAAGLTRIGTSMIALDAATLLFTGIVTTVVGAAIALAPAMQASSLRPVDAIKAGGSSGTARGFGAFGLRAGLVTAQIALALVLLAAAALMVKSAGRLLETRIGVNPSGVMTARLDLPAIRYDRQRGADLFTQVRERLRVAPGVQSVGLGSCPPLSGGCSSTTIHVPQGGGTGGREPIVGFYRVTPDYFPTLGIQLLQGRSFTERDDAEGRRVVLVNEAAARVFWPNQSPIGRVVTLGITGFDKAEVVGVVSNVRYRTLESAATPDAYVPAAQAYQPRMRIFVRSGLTPESMVQHMARALRELDADLALTEVKSMDERIGDAMWRTRVAAWLLSAFAGLALLLTAVGVFGVMSQTVTQRIPEIGVRIALGASGRQVMRLVLGRAVLLSAIGIAAGIAAALAVTRGMAALLYGVQPHDPWTYVVVSCALAAVALVACAVPARRAARVDPLTALRFE